MICLHGGALLVVYIFVFAGNQACKYMWGGVLYLPTHWSVDLDYFIFICRALVGAGASHYNPSIWLAVLFYSTRTAELLGESPAPQRCRAGCMPVALVMTGIVDVTAVALYLSLLKLRLAAPCLRYVT